MPRPRDPLPRKCERGSTRPGPGFAEPLPCREAGLREAPHTAAMASGVTDRADRAGAGERLRAAARRDRLGGTEGNELLTSATAVLLTLLLLAEGVTILRLGSLRTPHMLIGLALIPPVLLKLGSTGYRMVRYYAGTRPYREKGAPLLPLRVLAPVLVAMTAVVFASGVLLLLQGHNSGLLLTIHKASFIVWGACFAVHFLAYLPRVVRGLRHDLRAAHAARTEGARLRAALLAASLGSGAVLALALLSRITSWHAGG